MGNETAAVRFLIEMGAQVNTVAQTDGYLPLHAVASRDFIENKSLYTFYQLASSVRYPDAYNEAKISIIQIMMQLGINLRSQTREGLTVIDMLCGPCFYLFYKTIIWCLKQPIEMPFNGDIQRLNDYVDDVVAMAPTDCLMPAGFQCPEFVQKHLEHSIVTSNMREYQSAMHAYPFTLYQVDLYKLREEISNLKDCSHNDPALRNVQLNYMSRSYTRRTPDNDIYSVCDRAMVDQGVAPSLGQQVVYSIRRHLLMYGNNTTLHSMIERLEGYIPRTLIEKLSLQEFVDYSEPPGKRHSLVYNY